MIHLNCTCECVCKRQMASRSELRQEAVGKRLEESRRGNQLPDGVSPMDYPIVSEESLSCCCVRLIRSAYQLHTIFVCQDCYDTLDPDDQDLYEDSPTHFLCGIPGRIKAMHCRLCDIYVSQLQPATSCTECINAYLDLTQVEKNFLVLGTITYSVAP
ncbi:uncharacterized protein LOC126926438 isoform X2 [Bombus affinis]|uniref:uncharacterized protein LOC126926438 isoform X2 n=1 Tax=Bombus affinis TaxID=309941 RepID=UPI0021B7CE87|nr:uncharacterized protein LOC126926438 isoform X2 [Bombus affinis]